MMMKNSMIAALFLLLIPLWAFNQSETRLSYTISFKIKNAGITVDGNFKGFKGLIQFSPDNLAGSKLEGSIDVKTINTGIQARDNHLRSDDYFDVAKYPSITLNSKKLYQTNDGYEGLFDLTIKDVTRQIVLPFSYTEKPDMATFEANLTIDRRDYHVGGFSILMSDEVNIHILVNVLR